VTTVDRAFGADDGQSAPKELRRAVGAALSRRNTRKPALRWWAWLMIAVLAVLAIGLGVVALFAPSLLELAWVGDSQRLRDAPQRPVPEGQPTALIVAIDGVDRDLLYGMLRDGELPELAALLGGEGLEHAYLDETLLAPLPTSTLASWATIFSGATPAEHGVVGNEYFVRERRMFAGPAPVSVLAPDLVLKSYTDGYANDLLGAPTIYERLREHDPAFTAWVSLSQFHRGADRLLMADRSVVADAFAVLIGDQDGDHFELYASLDREVVATLIEALREHEPPRVLTVYLTGTDHFAHGEAAGPDAARRRYLREVVDDVIGDLARALRERDAIDDRYVLVLSDHGHTEVLHDDAHALSTDEEDDPPAVVRGAGYRLRPFEVEVDEDHDFDAVLCYGGAMAYVYVADRSTCEQAGTACDWSRPPRYDEDVVPLAEAFFSASARGTVPAMQGTLDMVLVRGDDESFHVYVGDGHTQPIGTYLARHPHRSYVEVESRLRDLAVGPHGSNAGDILLVARNGDEADPDDRYYFAGLYHSWHGSPSRQDSEIPFIVAHPTHSRSQIRARVRSVAGAATEATEIAPLLEALLYGGAEEVRQ
jgi:predicted AlkP superfamily pyrophosphatase or phosphodiesterase